MLRETIITRLSFPWILYILYFFLVSHSHILCFDSIFKNGVVLCQQPRTVQPHHRHRGVIR